MKTILLTGSSIFQQWSTAQRVAPDYKINNQAVGGTVTAYWRHNLAKLLTPEQADIVWLYCGSNDINQDVPDDEIIKNIAACRDIVRRFSDSTAFAYFSIIKAPQKLGKWERIDTLNESIRQGLADHDLYLETNVVFAEQAHDFFVDDGLHLTTKVYNALADYVKPIFTDWMHHLNHERTS